MSDPILEVRAGAEYVAAELRAMTDEAADRDFTADEQARFDEGVAFVEQARDRIERHNRLVELADVPAAREAAFHAPQVQTRTESGLEALSRAITPGDVRSVAMATIERSAGIDDAERTLAERTLARAETPRGDVARHIAATGSDQYRSAWGKLVAPGGAALLTSDEQRAVEAVRAASLTDAAGGYAVPFTLDPTIIYTGNGALNPFREISRTVQTTTDSWNGVSSAGVTVSWDGEAGEVSDDAPTLAQPSIPVYKAQGFVPFSIEVGQDWSAMESEIRAMFIKSKDVAEATVHATGSGSSQPTGIVTALAASSPSVLVTEASSETFTAGDVFALDGALPAEYENSASWVGHKVIYNLVRQFDTYGGANLWTQLGNGLPPGLLGHPVYKSSAMDSTFNAAATANNYLLILGDFSNYVIVDRIGLSVELVPHLFHTDNNRPSGQRGLYAYWRTGADSVNDNAFRMLNLDTAA